MNEMTVDILRRRMGASVLLIEALGGGWTVSELPKTAELRWAYERRMASIKRSLSKVLIFLQNGDL